MIGERQISQSPFRQAMPVQALIAAAAAHDPAMGAHAERTVQYAEATARELGRSDGEIYVLRLAARLHDIGKIGIPNAILHKPGPLNDEEWAVMRQHPHIGCQLLEQAGGIFRLLTPIVLAHHERWDGEGYPHKLAGERIPVGARILSVADAYDAMTSRRGYHKPMSQEQARQELMRCAGTQFDPLIVAAFMRALDRLEQEQACAPQLALA